MDGKFSVTGVPPGRYEVVATWERAEIDVREWVTGGAQNITVEEGRVTQLEVGIGEIWEETAKILLRIDDESSWGEWIRLMKVNDSNTPNLGNLNSTGIGKAAELEAAGKARDKQASTAFGPESDRVSLSNLSGTLRAALSESPDRAAQLEKLSADVATGRYNVDSGAVSKDIVNDATSGNSGTSGGSGGSGPAEWQGN
jgi:anti-sigma28 factor (negative regulator of flagellin synthesis)